MEGPVKFTDAADMVQRLPQMIELFRTSSQVHPLAISRVIEAVAALAGQVADQERRIRHIESRLPAGGHQ